MGKTYGEKPIVFRFEENGEEYMIGSEVGNYLRLFRGALYKKYPGLTRRTLANDERKKLNEMGHSQHVTSSTISLLLAREIDDIVNGVDDGYKSGGVGGGSVSLGETPAKVIPAKINKPTPAVPAMASSSHLDAVPQATPINRNRVIHKKIRTFPLCFDDTDPATVHENAAQPEILVPISLIFLCQVMCDDLDLNPVNFVPAITAAINQQLESFPSETENLLREQRDQRVVVKLNIHIGNHSLVDQFEWDIAEENNSPEEYSRKLCSELGLGGEFVTAVLYSIRGQLAWHSKNYVFSENQMPSIESAFRNQSDCGIWSPFLETLTDAEMEKKMRDQDRNTRRMRRLAATTPLY
ncbi:SWI/SNF-related matrix-associated actin-dependent regulator of chromatin subfamily B member 1 [Eurytemora carolleeae]|uniref:SWI/SNF-related matrix-associated actin-dependent regulator of chromatin subfamily B member 1 n=1 Tax=Eurytemora carolleeae TaxID=1294199 RepID=UPI000C794ED1|nr:SWI/SNF-related matrix-associated actin-dependent regulator of chromatin subfamily B member 1 [Eurytemora carolleeae]|eukprot:XP_023342102.1 SWI/SNF-related matrix-associated actin-dependent regulator of chromatin subfamily B member 1-like [Eurytemora affinis]